MSTRFFIREYRPDDFDAVTILWRISREKALPEFQNLKGHFFYEDQDYFRDHILKNNKVWVVELDAAQPQARCHENGRGQLACRLESDDGCGADLGRFY